MKLNHLAPLAAASLLACLSPGALMAQTSILMYAPQPVLVHQPQVTMVDPDSRFNGDKNLSDVGLRVGKVVSPS